MEAKYQVGDIVTIRQLSSEDDLSGKYRFGLNSEMIALSGKSFKIKEVQTSCSSPGKLPDDGYRYKLEDDARGWSWASSMFEDEDDEQTLIVDALSSPRSSESDNDISAFIRTKKRPKLDFNL